MFGRSKVIFNLVIVRTKYRGPRMNPGVEKRLRITEMNSQELIEDDLDPEFNPDQVHVSYKEHHKEIAAQKEKLSMDIVRQKFFKENHPNFLTWLEKEQIRYLHQTNPEEWTYEKLSDSYPALPETIKKVVKSHWRPESQNRINNHNEHVKRNWAALKKGELKLDERVKSHINKFSQRTPLKIIVDKSASQPNRITHVSEFRSIVAPISNESNPGDVRAIVKAEPVAIEMPECLQQKSLTLNEFKRITNKEIVPRTDLGTNNESYSELSETLANHALKVKTIPVPEVQVESYPEQIHIPDKVWKEGFTYKVNDCYYDDDGEFLYRVIGMTGKKQT